jgi:hypothetical protein
MTYHLSVTVNYPTEERDVHEGGLNLNALLSYLRNITEDFHNDMPARSIVLVIAKEAITKT